MKTWILASGLSMALAGLGIAEHQQDQAFIDSTEQYLYLPEVSQVEIQRWAENASAYVLVCPEGTVLPLRFFLNGELLELEAGDHPADLIKIKRTFYLRWQGEELHISFDASSWKTWNEMLTGTLSFSINVEDNGPLLQLGAVTHYK